ncbi:hypothetical protein PPACK8108_LOCUS9464 [Phakopsora pachyrhizi]|uniref:Uncharacterized protein n=1 Tax=Phakopsora pachyrhizi TaxID=170000 RepID=A0AAV0AZB0_PHAPC|nr:hypothetical protein PPACK8108_LOCUS9464 [Phakopsora pachyrhizi]
MGWKSRLTLYKDDSCTSIKTQQNLKESLKGTTHLLKKLLNPYPQWGEAIGAIHQVSRLCAEWGDGGGPILNGRDYMGKNGAGRLEGKVMASAKVVEEDRGEPQLIFGMSSGAAQLMQLAPRRLVGSWYQQRQGAFVGPKLTTAYKKREEYLQVRAYNRTGRTETQDTCVLLVDGRVRVVTTLRFTRLKGL